MFQSLDQFRAQLMSLPEPDASAQAAARAHQEQLTKPPGSLGRLEKIAIHMAGWRGGRNEATSPCADHIEAIVFAGNHGVTAQGVSPYPADVTQQMVANFEAGGAAINAMTLSLGLNLKVVPLVLDRPTQDICVGPALEDAELLDALNTGAASVSNGIDVLVLGEMGIGNTTIAAALSAISFGGVGRDWAGPGTGLDNDGVTRKAQVIDCALELHQGAKGDVVEILRCLGGRETAAIAGAIISARLTRIPVILDGYVVCASVAPLFAVNPDIVSHCLAGHLSAEPAHGRLLAHMDLKPILDLDMRLGEGTGAALAAGIVKAAVAAHNTMATFDEARVAQSGNVDPSLHGTATNLRKPVSADHE